MSTRESKGPSTEVLGTAAAIDLRATLACVLLIVLLGVMITGTEATGAYFAHNAKSAPLSVSAAAAFAAPRTLDRKTPRFRSKSLNKPVLAAPIRPTTDTIGAPLPALDATSPASP